MSIWFTFIELRIEQRWMLFAAFLFNLGFYMLIPFLAGFFKEELLLSATLIGLVLGLRSFCQQGLFIVGGLLADIFGNKLLIISGCLLRAIGFWLFLFSSSTFYLFAAAILTGFAGALFTPAAQAYFSEQKDISRAQMFSLVGVARNGGELLGPVIGVMLLGISFNVLCFSAALPFAIFALVFSFLLPGKRKARKPEVSTSRTAKGMLAEVLKNTPFIRFSILMVGYFMLINQISFVIPLHIVNQNGSQQEIAWVLTLCALVSVFLQIPITRYCEARQSPEYWIRLGIALMGLSFLVLIPVWPSDFLIAHYVALSALAITFTVGTMMSFPFILSQISMFANGNSVATHYGFFYLFAGIGLVCGSSLIGVIFDLAGMNKHYVWYCLAAIGSTTAFLHMLLMPPTVKPMCNQQQNSPTS